MALMVMAAFDLYLRPGEGLSLVARNIVAPIPVAGSQFRVVTVIVRDFDSGVPDKVGVYDTSLRMDNPKTAWVGEFLLKKAKEVNSKDDLIFSFNMEEYRKEFIAVGKLLGVDQLLPLSVAPRWGIPRPLQRLQRSPGSQEQRPLGDRSKCEEICQNRQGPAALVETPSKQFKLLHMGRDQFRESVPRCPAVAGSVSEASWEDVFFSC